MKSKVKILNVVKYVSLTSLTFGIISFFIGLFVNGYSVLTPIGIGIVIGSVFIFLIGVFFVVTEEILNKMYLPNRIVSITKKERH